MILAGLAAVLAASPARAAAEGGQVYVVANDGNDRAPGTADAPLKTLQRAADLVQPGDTVLVKAGTYAGMNFYRGIGGTPGHPIRFQAGPNVIINRAGKAGPNPDSGINLEPGKGWFVFSGFHIVNADGSMERACIRVTSNEHTQVLNNVCEKGGNWGIFASTSNDLLIEGNTCRDSPGQHGIYVSRGSKSATIRGNTLSGNHWDGLHLNGGAEGPIDHSLVENNVIFNNELTGIDGDGVQNSVFRNNVVYDNGKHAVSLYRRDTATGSYHNVFVNNTLVSHSMFAIQMQPGSTANTLYNNILLHTGGGAYGSVGVVKSAPGLVSDYNVVSDRFSADVGVSRFGLDQWRKMTGQDAHTVLVPSPESLFVDAAKRDFHLRAGSAASHAGNGAVEPDALPAKDIDGKVRSKDHGWSAGAYF
jgi:parallel beta-helix repeat protein